MPRLVSLWMRLQIRLIKPIVTRMTIRAARKMQDRLGALESAALASRVCFTAASGCFPTAPGDMPEACFALPRELAPSDDRVVLYLHGGGYVAGNIDYARGFAGVLAARCQRRVLCVAYRLAPEDPYPAAVEDALRAYQYLLEAGYRARDISLCGESAGGGLIYCLCLRLRAEGLALPGALVALSPWTDLTFSGASYHYNRFRDPILSEAELRRYARAYASGKAEEPFVSPVRGDFSGFPPSLIFAGSHELLLEDSRMLAERLLAAGCDCTLHVADGLWHVYVLFGIPEAWEALTGINDFLEAHDEREQ